MKCDRCSSENPEDNFYCGRCGALLSLPPEERLFQRSNWGAILVLVSAVATALATAIDLILAITLAQSGLYPMWFIDTIQIAQSLQLYTMAGLWILGIALVLRSRGIARVPNPRVGGLLLGAAALSVAGHLIAYILGNPDVALFLFGPSSTIIQSLYLGLAVGGIGTSLFLGTLSTMMWKRGQPSQ